MVDNGFSANIGNLGGNIFSLDGTSTNQGFDNLTEAEWNTYAGLEVLYNLDIDYLDGQVNTIACPLNNMVWTSEIEQLDGLAVDASLVKASITVDISTGLSVEANVWYVFFSEEGKNISYALYMNASSFTREDIIAMAKTVVFKDGAFDIEVR